MRNFLTFFLGFLVLFFSIYLFFSLQKMQDLNKLQQVTKYFLIFEILLFIAAIFGLYLFNTSKAEVTFPRNPFFSLALLMIPVSMMLFSSVLFLEDLFFGLKWIFSKIIQIFNNKTPQTAISRSEFLLQTGFWLSTIPFAAALLSLKQAHEYSIKNVKIFSKKIPKKFQNFKIIQILLSGIRTGFW